jgi:hypothetical protein
LTHDDWAAALPRYAAGELEEEAAEAVRGHLASGCETCLATLFRLPVGRSVEPEPARTASRGFSPLAPAAVLLALGLAGIVAWTIFDLRERETDGRVEGQRLASRIADVEASRRETIARLRAAETELDTTRAEMTNAHEAAAAAIEARHDLERMLGAAEERIGTLERGIRRRDRQIDRLLGPVSVPSPTAEWQPRPGWR